MVVYYKKKTSGDFPNQNIYLKINKQPHLNAQNYFDMNPTLSISHLFIN